MSESGDNDNVQDQGQGQLRPRSLTRTLSETLFGFARKGKRSRDNDGDDYSDNNNNNNERSSSVPVVPVKEEEGDEPERINVIVEDGHVSKKKKLMSKEEEAEIEKKKVEFLNKEKELAELLKPEYRKWRPKGFKMNPPPEDRPIRIYADGVFDLFHLGHMRQLEQCKKAFNNVELVVGIPNDKETHKRKGLTVLTDKQRYETVRHCKWVDEVIEDAPWILSMKFLKDNKIDYCAHDDLPYVADGIDDIYLPMKKAGMFLATQRTEGISTSDIITKIIRDYDKYLMRNFARGATRQELNVSWLKKNELELKKNITDFKNSWKQTNDNLSHLTKDLYILVRESLINNNFNNSITNGKSPADKFALKYNANGLSKSLINNKNNNKKSILGNFMDWVGLQSEVDSTDEDSSSEITSKNVKKLSSRTSTPRKALPSSSNDVKQVKTPKKSKPKAILGSAKKTPKKVSKKTLQD